MYSELCEILKHRVLLLDGAMGTMIQRLRLSENDFRGKRFVSHPVRLAGCNDLLCLTRPGDIKAIHAEYLKAGADIVTTNTFNANAVSLEDYGLHDSPDLIREINREGARLAREAAVEAKLRSFGRRALVAGSMGPTNKTASMSPDVADPSLRNIDYASLFNAYHTQAEGLIEGGADILLFETVFDTLNLKAGLDAASHVMAEKGIWLPVMVSATVADKSGRTLSGQTLEAFTASVGDYPEVVSLGLNCSFGPSEIIPFIKELATISSKFISCHPNAGLPDALGRYMETPEIFSGHVRKILDEATVNIIGGCCGTTPAHISALRSLVDSALPHIPAKIPPALRVSGLERLEIMPENNFVNVGERCNVAGSRKFLRLIKEKKYEEAVEIAARQVADGAMMIDVNMDDALLDAREEMVRFLRYISSDPDIARVPVMVDSSDWNVIEAALMNLQGKSIVNSISLKEGEEAFLHKAKRIRELGAAVIVMAFDEEGQADTFERKIEVSRRAYHLLLDVCGFNPEDIIFDVNIMAVATGLEEHLNYGIDFIRAVEWIKKNLPGARTSGGVSNLSFAFRGKNALREAMHAVFLYHAISAGLDMAIVNPASSVTYEEIDPSLRSIIEDVVLARRPEACDELAAYASRETDSKGTAMTAPARDISVPVSRRLTEAVVRGKAEYLDADLTEALSEFGSPVAIIEGPLMEGMNRVGNLFGEGKMFLPQVVKTARTMKMAVDWLRPYMESGRIAGEKAGKVVFATVKGDVHDIGKNIVSIVLACNNYEVIDLGVMVPAEKIVETALREKPDIICLSGLITPSLSEMVNVAKAMREAGLTIPIIVGGATTSRIHTALKIAPQYDGVVVHASDAARDPLIAGRLLNPATREYYIREIDEDHRLAREEFSASANKLLSISEARTRHVSTVWKEYAPVVPAAGIDNVLRIDLPLERIVRLVNWKMFFHAWRLAGPFLDNFPYDGCDACRRIWISGLSDSVRDKAMEALKVYDDAMDLIRELTADGSFDGKAVVRFCKAFSVGDDIRIGSECLPMLRQQSDNSVCLSLADFIAPEKGPEDYAGVFALSAGHFLTDEATCRRADGDEYGALLRQTLADRLAEAASEWLHMEVRRRLWGYASQEDLDDEALLRGGYAGIRPAVGYPMLPDQTLIHNLARLIPLDDIGVGLTENGAMTPTSSVCGLYIGNPSARYFMVGAIGADQVKDYASRRGIGEERMREILRI